MILRSYIYKHKFYFIHFSANLSAYPVIINSLNEKRSVVIRNL